MKIVKTRYLFLHPSSINNSLIISTTSTPNILKLQLGNEIGYVEKKILIDEIKRLDELENFR